MNEVYILIIVKEETEKYAEVQTAVYRNIGDAIHAYEAEVDGAREEAEKYIEPVEDELATDTYRWFRIYDAGYYNSITIEIQTHEIIEGDSDDI